MQAPTENLLTPVGLYLILNKQFEIYRNQNKLWLLKDGVTLPEFQFTKNNDLKGKLGQLASKAGQFALKKGAALGTSIYEYMLQHTALTQFVTKEMQDILAQENASPLKKMIDLTILFDGLYNFIALEPNSAEFLPLLDQVKEDLWAATSPFKIDNDRLMELTDVDEEKTDKPQPREKRQDEIAFNDRFQIQINRAFDLMKNNTTESSQTEFARLKQKSTDKYGATGTVLSSTSAAGIKSKSAPIIHYDAWHYRCTDIGQKNPSNELLEGTLAYWKQEKCGLFGNDEQRALAYVQLGVGLLQPEPSMGLKYNDFLLKLSVNDHTLLEDPKTLEEAVMQLDSSW
jgi:hypothetical protein